MCEGANLVPSLDGMQVLAVVLDATQALAVATTLACAGASVRATRNVYAARAALAETPFDVVLLDRGLAELELDALLVELGALHCAHVMLAEDDDPEGGERSPSAALVAGTLEGVEATLALRRAAQAPPHTPPPVPVPVLRPVPRVEQAIDALAECRRLSPREHDVLRCIALGYKYVEIGQALSISVSTVKMHATNVRRKVGAGTRGELMRKMFAA